jgi:hypothetical protein
VLLSSQSFRSSTASSCVGAAMYPTLLDGHGQCRLLGGSPVGCEAGGDVLTAAS